VVDDPLGVRLERAGLVEVAALEARDREHAGVVAAHARERALEQVQPAFRQVLVQAPVDLVRLDPGPDQLGRHQMRVRRRVLVHEAAGVGDEPDVERLRHLRRDLRAQLLRDPPHDLGRARGLRIDQVDGPEAGVVVVVVDVDDVGAVVLEEVDRHPIDVPAVEEHHHALADVLRRRGEQALEAHVAVLDRKRELVRRHVHRRVLAELRHEAVHRDQRAERVAVGILVRGQQQLVGLPQLLDHGVELGRNRHSRPSSWSRSSSLIRIPRSIDSS
jgi:hypothetical protein